MGRVAVESEMSLLGRYWVQVLGPSVVVSVWDPNFALVVKLPGKWVEKPFRE